MQPYVVRQNDYLLKIAFNFGFDADSVWNDPSNDDLRKLRPDPNMLLAGDVMYIPDEDANEAPAHNVLAGSTNVFVAPNPPTISVTQTFSDADSTTYASRAYTVTELPDLTGLVTDENGTATFSAPVSLDSVTIVFTDTGESWQLVLGGMDPIDTLVGVFKRLQNLHYIGAHAQYDFVDPSNSIEVVRDGLRRLKAALGETPEQTPESPTDPSTSDSPDGSVAAPDADDGGLSDGGILDDDTRALLLKAYGS
jgi:hypothetical protein